jgi:hypothetical protein
MNEQKIRDLLDKQDITEVIVTYGRALDRFDENLLRSVFHPDSKHAHGFIGPSSDPSLPSSPGAPGDFVAYAYDVLRTHTRTHHQLGNILIELSGDDAYAETYFTAYHRMRALGDPEAAENAYDTEMDFLVGGRYIDRFEKRDGVWKVSHRTGLTDWMRTEQPSSQGYFGIPAQLQGRRGEEDLVFRAREAYKQ